MFKFDVKLTEQDYLDFNFFHATKSHYGKKQTRTFRIALAAVLGTLMFIELYGNGFSASAFVSIIPLAVGLVLMQILFTAFVKFTLKMSIKGMKKTGKMGYSEESVMEFLEDKFVETTAVNKTEQIYSSIERISVIDNRTVYIHVNNIMAYILPMTAFESREHYNAFLEFIKTKAENIDYY